jgi:hypothetical protein
VFSVKKKNGLNWTSYDLVTDFRSEGVEASDTWTDSNRIYPEYKRDGEQLITEMVVACCKVLSQNYFGRKITMNISQENRSRAAIRFSLQLLTNTP